MTGDRAFEFTKLPVAFIGEQVVVLGLDVQPVELIEHERQQRQRRRVARRCIADHRVERDAALVIDLELQTGYFGGALDDLFDFRRAWRCQQGLPEPCRQLVEPRHVDHAVIEIAAQRGDDPDQAGFRQFGKQQVERITRLDRERSRGQQHFELVEHEDQTALPGGPAGIRLGGGTFERKAQRRQELRGAAA